MNDVVSKKNSQSPPHSVCVVFDSQLSARKQLVKDLNSSAMFDRVEEPDFLSPQIFNDADGQIDTCLLGPNISVENACSFIDESLETEQGRQCSYVAVVDESDSEDRAPLKERVDGVLEGDYDIQKLIEIVSQSVGTAKKRRPPESKEFGIRGLKEIANGYYKGQYMLSIQGTPSKKAITAMEDMIRGLSGGDKRKEELLMQLLLPLLVDWFVDLAEHSEEVATKRLRPRLVQVLGSERPSEK